MKTFDDLRIGDKVFIIHKSDYTFDVAEVIEILNTIIGFQCYFNSEIFYLWRYPFTRHDIYRKIVFTDENEAIEEFKLILKHNQNGRDR